MVVLLCEKVISPGAAFAPANPFGFIAARIGEGPAAINSIPSDVLLSTFLYITNGDERPGKQDFTMRYQS